MIQLQAQFVVFDGQQKVGDHLNGGALRRLRAGVAGFGVQLRDFGERVLQGLLIDVELFLDALEMLFGKRFEMKLKNFQGDALREAPGQFGGRPVLGIEFALQLQLQTLFQIPRANARRVQRLHHR